MAYGPRSVFGMWAPFEGVDKTTKRRDGNQKTQAVCVNSLTLQTKTSVETRKRNKGITQERQGRVISPCHNVRQRSFILACKFSHFISLSLTTVHTNNTNKRDNEPTHITSCDSLARASQSTRTFFWHRNDNSLCTDDLHRSHCPSLLRR